MLGFTGTWQGHRVSVQGSGMGQPSLAIYATELFREYDVESIIRVGSAGALTEKLKIRDIVIASGACTDSSMNRIRFEGLDYAPVADFGLLAGAVAAAGEPRRRARRPDLQRRLVLPGAARADGPDGRARRPRHRDGGQRALHDRRRPRPEGARDLHRLRPHRHRRGDLVRGARADLRRHGRDRAGRRHRWSRRWRSNRLEPTVRLDWPTAGSSITWRGFETGAGALLNHRWRRTENCLHERSPDVDVLDSVVIGAGQAGLSTSYHLQRRGIDHVVLDADDSPGGAWQHRWDSLTMQDVHGIAALPDAEPPTEHEGARQRGGAGVLRGLRARPPPAGAPAGAGRRGRRGRGRAAQVVRAGDRTLAHPHDRERDRDWSRPFVPRYPGAETFRGRQLHTHDYPGPEPFRGRRVRRRRRRRLGGAAARRDRAGRGGHALGDPARAGLAHRRLHSRGGPGRGRAGRGAGTPRACRRPAS